MTRGRKPLLDPPIGVEIMFPKTVLARISLALMDPVTGGRKKGALSALVVGLTREWLDKMGHTGVQLPHEREARTQPTDQEST